MFSNEHTPSQVHAKGIAFECEDFPIHFSPMLQFDWCSVHHVKAGNQEHSISLMRDAVTLLVFDRGNYYDGWRSIDGVRLGQQGIIGTGVDVVPAGAHLRGWSGLRSSIGCTLISIAPAKLSLAFGDELQQHQFRPASNISNELLQSLASRISALSTLNVTESSTLHTETMLSLLTQELLRVQNSHGTGSAHRGGLAPRAERQIRDFVQEHMGSCINMETLANVAGLSRFHFSRAFKISFGISPHKYLQQERLQKACELMEHTDSSITDIALQVGFTSSSELARTFKAIKGFSPRQYRSALSSRAIINLPLSH